MIKKGDTITHKLTGLELLVSDMRLIDGQGMMFEAGGALIKEEEIRKYWSYQGDSEPVPGIGSVWRHASGLIGNQTGIDPERSIDRVIVDTEHGQRIFFPGDVGWTLIESAKEKS